MALNENGWQSAVMDFEGHSLRLSLTIRNFTDYYGKPGDELESPEMECTNNCGAKWKLHVSAFGTKEEEKDDIVVFLQLGSKPPHIEFISATWQIYILGKDCNKYPERYPENDVENVLVGGIGHNSLITRSEVLSNKDLYLPNGHLTIRCEGKAFLKKPYRKRNIATNPTSSVLKTIYQESICTDVILKTGLNEFKCHKNILSATSNYFKAMFQHDMKENRENVVDLSEDLNVEELRALLDYIYLGKREFVNLTLNSYQTLYRVSDMYEMNGLQEVCETELIKLCDLGNSSELFNFSDQFGAKRLKKAVASIIVTNLD